MIYPVLYMSEVFHSMSIFLFPLSLTLGFPADSLDRLCSAGLSAPTYCHYTRASVVWWEGGGTGEPFHHVMIKYQTVSESVFLSSERHTCFSISITFCCVSSVC